MIELIAYASCHTMADGVLLCINSLTGVIRVESVYSVIV